MFLGQSAASDRFFRFVSAHRKQLMASWEDMLRERVPEADPQRLRDLMIRLLDAPYHDETTVSNEHPGASLGQLVASYQLIRAAVGKLVHHNDELAEEKARFDTLIDRRILMAVAAYTDRVDDFREAFMAMMGHDLRTPLHAITLLSHLMSRPDIQEAELRQMAAQIAESASSMNMLIRGVLDFTNAQIGPGIPIAAVSMNLETLCHQAVDEVKKAFPQRGVMLHRQGDPSGE